jgi:hypothetical protein
MYIVQDHFLQEAKGDSDTARHEEFCNKYFKTTANR